jgi:hypothetical protein
MADFSLNVKINGAEQAVTTVSQIEQALIATRNELKNVAIGSTAFQELSTQAQTLQREFVNSYKETTNFNKGIAELGQSVGSLASTVTAGFAIATSAFSLFGAESEDISQAQVKAQQALALALGATTIATNAKTLTEDLSNVAAALGLNLSRAKTAATIVDTEVTTVNTAATVANAAATGVDAVAKQAEAVATTEAAVAQEGLNVAMAANPVGLILVGLTALIGALVLFAGGEETAKSKTKEANAALLEQSDLLRKQSDDFIAVYKLRREVEILSIKSASERAQKTKELEEEVGALQKDAIDAQIKRVEQANGKILGDFEEYEGAYTGIKRELVSVTNEYDEFGVWIGQSENYKDVEYKVGQSTLDNLRTNLAERIKEIDTSAKYEKTSVDEKNLLKRQAETDFHIEYLKSQQKFLASSTQADDEQRAKNLADLIDSFKQVRGQLEKAYADQLRIQEEAAKKAAEQQVKDDEEATKKAAEALKERQRKYKEAYNDIVKTVKDANKQLADAETSYTQQLQKAQLDKTTTAVDNIEYEKKLELEKLDAIKVAAEKSLMDSVLYNKKKKTLTEEGKKAELELEKNFTKAKEDLDAFYLDKVKVTTEEEVRLAQEKADKLKLINDVLNSEISFGDQNILDSKASLAQRERQLAIDSLDYTQQVEAAKGLVTVEQFRKYQEERLKLVNEYNKKQQAIEVAGAAAARDQATGNFKENLKKEFGEEFVATKEGKALIEKFGLNAEEEYQTKLKEIKQKYNKENDANTKKSEADVLAFRLAQLDKFNQIASQIANAVLGVFNAFNELAKVNSENYLNEQRDLTAQQTSNLNEEYNAQKVLLDEKLASGVISQQQYDETIKGMNTGLTKSTEDLNKAFRAKELAEKKKAFESDKKLKIAQAIISGISGALSAFTGAFQLGPIAGPIVGGILAGLVAATTAVQVAAISKTKFDGGAPEITPPNTGGAGGADTGAGAVTTAASTGGFTGFNQGLLGTPGGAGATGTVLNPGSAQRVYILESDITNTQRRVSTLESNASFG